MRRRSVVGTTLGVVLGASCGGMVLHVPPPEVAPTATASASASEAAAPIAVDVPCTTVRDCPGTDDDCKTRVCASGKCAETHRARGTGVAEQVAGDCARRVCDGSGSTMLETDAADAPVALACWVGKCVGGRPRHVAAPEGTSCSTKLGTKCDGSGECVACVDDSDCSNGVCSDVVCRPASCGSGLRDGSESDVDCGGHDCSPCEEESACKADSDCETSCSKGKCAAATCTDGKKNGEEADVDCGGAACPRCAGGKRCSEHDDCIGGECSGAVCLPSCSDKVQNGSETDLDCGGGGCRPCGGGQRCVRDGDCSTHVCKHGRCVAG